MKGLVIIWRRFAEGLAAAAFTVMFFGFVAGMIEAAKSPDPAMAIQGWIFAACMFLIGIWYLWRYASRTPQDELGPYSNSVIKAGVIAWALDGRPFSIVGFTIVDGLIVEIDILGDRRLDGLALEAPEDLQGLRN